MRVLLGFALMWLSLSLSAQQQLFNGKDLNGWQAYGTEKWYVEEGLLISESGPDEQYGYLCTTEFYDDFVLTLEFLQEANGNSGVFFRSTVDGTKVQGWQVEVAPPNKHTGGIYESYGRGWLIKPSARREAALMADAWNTMKIKAKGDRVTTWLNGKRMVRIKDEKIGTGEGGICLQIHDGGGIRVKWKNLELKPL
ncbi:MAG: DUF1080 domain-containing protein [Phaeodactylibacter xiamenensis]|uniref:3-keto-alpha-glucoside-1,2-lyase/3-keto-2-hydroxy-glucal hydratase domain-containing protein n=1 Tax=Phaeodactylibacter xiamenensis TaxID=1524460 RepID=A0A098S122_9BACT|nr:DUF1080 domain-containing protein [Phaeodactylibacter xiamenensis]KGE86074.1 hypothetical protein IX84_23330 [Phaeodactylibacter xiamenensis]MCR9050414.1 DUF1080 domain-containing protein [bacterium]